MDQVKVVIHAEIALLSKLATDLEIEVCYLQQELYQGKYETYGDKDNTNHMIAHITGIKCGYEIARNGLYTMLGKISKFS